MWRHDPSVESAWRQTAIAEIAAIARQTSDLPADKKYCCNKQADDKQYPGDAGCCTSNTTEPQDAGNDRYNKKSKSPSKHCYSPYPVTSILLESAFMA
jgi:hypothetical protein